MVRLLLVSILLASVIGCPWHEERREDHREDRHDDHHEDHRGNDVEHDNRPQ